MYNTKLKSNADWAEQQANVPLCPETLPTNLLQLTTHEDLSSSFPANGFRRLQLKEESLIAACGNSHSGLAFPQGILQANSTRYLVNTLALWIAVIPTANAEEECDLIN